MIYVVQKQHSIANDPVKYAGSSAHEALIIASQFEYCKITAWKTGKKFQVVAKSDEVKPASTKGSEG